MVGQAIHHQADDKKKIINRLAERPQGIYCGLSLLGMNKVLRFTFFLCISWGVGLSIKGIPAYPKKTTVCIDGKVFNIRIFGDEYCKFAETEDGYTILQKSGKWFFASKDSTGRLTSTSFQLKDRTEEETRRYLQMVGRHLRPSEKAMDVRRSMRQSSAKRQESAIGMRKVLVILMQYKDLSLKKNKSDFEKLFNGVGYSEDGAQGSVRDFYSDVSYGQLQLTCDVLGPYTAKHSRAYYGENDRRGDDSRPEELFEEAIEYAIEHVSLADYDADKDGYVDNVHIIFAGHGEEAGASDDAIWSHEATFYQPFTIQGMNIDRYSCAPELRGNSGSGISRIGPHCHEIGHALGAMDYYDTDYEENGGFEGTGQWDIMAGGSWNNDGITPADFNPYVKAFDFGWVSPNPLPVGEVVLSPSCHSAENYYIAQSGDDGDYYLLENRNSEKWGVGVPGEGLLIFHIHPDIASSGNQINAAAPQKCYIVCAASRSQRPGSNFTSYGDINSKGCPYPGTSGNHHFGQSSTPRAFCWSDYECAVEINDIYLNADGTIRLVNNGSSSDLPDVTRSRLFYEDFETGQTKVSVEDVDDIAPRWSIVANPEAPSKFIKAPYAYSGTHSMQLSARHASEKVASKLTFSTEEPAATATLKIKLYHATLNPVSNTPNVLNVGYKTIETDEWHYITVESSENNRWRQSIISLPEGARLTFCLEGIAQPGSILAIDNLEVEQEIQQEETMVYDKAKPNNGISSIYSITGQKRLGLVSGLNIVNNGTIKKIIVK